MLYRATLAFIICLFATGCASKQPAQVPSLGSGSYPRVKFPGLEPRELQLTVKNARKINIDAGNAAAVEAAVVKSLTSALSRDNIPVKKKSTNTLALKLTDYSGPGAEGQCVKVAANLKLPSGYLIQADSFACHNYKNFLGLSSGGDVSQAYEHAIGMILTSLDQKLQQISGETEEAL